MKGAQLRFLQPEYNLRVDREEIERVARSELADWLALEWFYPDGFTWQRLRETPNHFICTGKTLEYVFPKQIQLGRKISFASRLEQVIGVAQKSQLLAADSVLGVKLLRWQKGELVWLEGMYNALSKEIPQMADEVALVLKRIPDGSRLSDILLDGGELSVEQVDLLVQKIVRFHDVLICDSDCGYSSSYVNETILAPLKKFRSEYEGYLDLFSRIAIKEIEGYLSSFIANYELLFRRRAKEGFVASTHGCLRAHQVVVSPLLEGSDLISIVGRDGKEQDVLADLAALVIDLDSCEAEYLSQELVRRYQILLPECFNAELFHFYKVAEGLRAAIEAFSEAGVDRTVRANKALGRALRAALQFPDNVLLVVCGSAVGEAQGLAEAIAELLSLEYLSVEDLREGIRPQMLSEQALFDRFSEWSDRLIAERGALVAQWCGETTALNLNVYTQIKSWLAAKDIPYRLIRCDEFELSDGIEVAGNLAKNSQIMLALQIAQSFQK